MLMMVLTFKETHELFKPYSIFVRFYTYPGDNDDDDADVDDAVDVIDVVDVADVVDGVDAVDDLVDASLDDGHLVD